MCVYQRTCEQSVGHGVAPLLHLAAVPARGLYLLPLTRGALTSQHHTRPLNDKHQDRVCCSEQ